MRIERVDLPGIGVRFTLHTVAGQFLGVIRQHSGSTELVIYMPGDPDTAQQSLALTPGEAQQVAELLRPISTIEPRP